MKDNKLNILLPIVFAVVSLLIVLLAYILP